MKNRISNQPNIVILALVAIVVLLGLVLMVSVTLHTTNTKNFAANETGGLNQPCNADHTCNIAGLTCVYATSTSKYICAVLPQVPSKYATGNPGEPCKTDGTCIQGYTCGKVGSSYFCIQSANSLGNGNQSTSQTIGAAVPKITPIPSSLTLRKEFQACSNKYPCDTQANFICRPFQGATNGNGICVKLIQNQ